MRSYEVSEYDKSLLLQPSITYKVKFEVMDESMSIINSIEGVVVGGTYSINSTSDVRRTVSITVVPTQFYDTNMVLDPHGYIWLNKIIRLYIGIVDVRTGRTKYFSEGYYYYTNVSGTYNTSTNTLSLSLSDFMINLNGTKNGQLAAWVTSIPAYIEDEKGRPIVYHPIKDAMATTLTQLSSYVKSYYIEDIGEAKGMPRFNYNYESYRKRHKIWNAVPYDLEFNTGDSVLSIITTLRDLYPNFETYFDPVTNDFVCQMIPSLDNDEVIIDNTFLQMVTQSENISTNLTTVRNVCEVWGEVLECDYYADESYTANAYQTIMDSYQQLLERKRNQLLPLDHQIANLIMSLEWVESEQAQTRLNNKREELENAKSKLLDLQNQFTFAQAELAKYIKASDESGNEINIYYFSEYVAKWNVEDRPKTLQNRIETTEARIKELEQLIKDNKREWAQAMWSSYRNSEDLKKDIDDDVAYDLYRTTVDPVAKLQELTDDVANKEQIRQARMAELSNVAKNRSNYSSEADYQNAYNSRLTPYLQANEEYNKAVSYRSSLSRSIPYLTIELAERRREKDEREKELQRIYNDRASYYSEDSWRSAVESAERSFQSAVDNLDYKETELQSIIDKRDQANTNIYNYSIEKDIAEKNLKMYKSEVAGTSERYREEIRDRYTENVLEPIGLNIRQQNIIIDKLQKEYDILYTSDGYENIQRLREELNTMEAERSIIEEEYWDAFERQRSRIETMTVAEQTVEYAYIAEIDTFPTEYESGSQIAVRICETNIGRTCYLKINNLETIPIFEYNTDYFPEPETFEPNGVYVFQIEHHGEDGLPDTIAYLLGRWQVHAIDVLTDGMARDIWVKQIPQKDEKGNPIYDEKGNIKYNGEVVKDKEGNAVYVYSQKYFEMKYDCDNVHLTIIKDSPFTVQKLGEIVDVKSGDRFEKIQSDAVAIENAIYENWKNCRLTDTITLQTLLIPFADVNTKVSYRPQNETRIKEYIISSINHNLSTFTSSITMYRYYPLYMNNTVTTEWTSEEEGTVTWVPYVDAEDYTSYRSFDRDRRTILSQFKARYNVDERKVSISGTITLDLTKIITMDHENQTVTTLETINEPLVKFNNDFILPTLKQEVIPVYLDSSYSDTFIKEPIVAIDPYSCSMYIILYPDTTLYTPNIYRDYARYSKSKFFTLMFNFEYTY